MIQNMGFPSKNKNGDQETKLPVASFKTTTLKYVKVINEESIRKRSEDIQMSLY